MTQGDNVVRVLIAHEERHRRGRRRAWPTTSRRSPSGLVAERLPDGSGFAYFKNFIYIDDIEDFLCEELAQAPRRVRRPPRRDPRLASTEIDCSRLLRRQLRVTASGPPAASPLSPEQLAAAQQDVFDAYYGAVAQPDQPNRESCGPRREPPGGRTRRTVAEPARQRGLRGRGPS